MARAGVHLHHAIHHRPAKASAKLSNGFCELVEIRVGICEELCLLANLVADTRQRDDDGINGLVGLLIVVSGSS